MEAAAVQTPDARRCRRARPRPRDTRPREQLTSQFLITGIEAESFNRFLRKLTVQPKGPLDDDFPISKRLIRKNLRLFVFFERNVRITDSLDILAREFAILLSEIFAKRFEPFRCIN